MSWKFEFLELPSTQRWQCIVRTLLLRHLHHMQDSWDASSYSHLHLRLRRRRKYGFAIGLEFLCKLGTALCLMIGLCDADLHPSLAYCLMLSVRLLSVLLRGSRAPQRPDHYQGVKPTFQNNSGGRLILLASYLSGS